jgi:methionyl-tRNA formyltransferase
MEPHSRRTRIVFMGTPAFAVPSLKALIDGGFNIVAVVTQPDRPHGRGRRLRPSPVKETALESGIEVIEPQKIRDEGFLKRLKTLEPDLIAVVAYGKILPNSVLQVPRLGCVNLHASILPRYRGAAPVNWAIIRGEKTTGMSTTLMDEGLDSGPLLLTEGVSIEDEETAEDLGKRLAGLGAALLKKTVGLLEEKKIEPAPQDEGEATYAPRLKKEDGRVDWGKGAEEIRNLVRGLYPWPGAYTHWKGRHLKIHRGRAVKGPGAPGASGDGRSPGTVVETSDEGIRIKCGRGIFEITELQMEGKRRMSAGDFLKGYRLGDEVFE